jgi:FlaA1/EpsC-like NDP-sugar epimerase
MDINTFFYSFIGRRGSMFSKDLSDKSSELALSIKDKSLLVIGGAGSIGSSFIKAALQFRPKKLVVVDINENGLTELVRDLRSTKDQYVPESFFTYPISFDSNAFKKLFVTHGPFEIVTNFAALKHVRSEKDIFSIEALLENNVLKAKKLMDILLDNPPSHFFCVSTDKAANPVNIMGASKKLMEELILSYANSFKVTSARFANVAFSNGSLLDGFVSRRNKNQPIACPNDVQRFFVSPEESGQICLLACILGRSGEIFFPKLDMKKDLIKFSEFLPQFLKQEGFVPLFCDSEQSAKENVHQILQKKYPVFLFETNASGEKLYEEFYTESEDYNIDKYHALGFIKKNATYSRQEMNQLIGELNNLFLKEELTKSEIVGWLKSCINDFDHIETGIGLDSKM